MRQVLFICIAVALLAGCIDTPDGKGDDEVWNRTDRIWEYKFDTTTNDFRIVKLRDVSEDTLTVPLIETIVNTAWPEVQVEYLKTSRDTVFVSISQSEVLTQQMGSAGAQQFLISATFSFTELKGVNYVSYIFVPGDHAEPGVYSRKSWRLLEQELPETLN